MRRFLALLRQVALAAVVAAAPAAHAGTDTAITGVRFGDHPGKTRIVLDLNAKTPFKLVPADDPIRIVIELPAVSWALDGKPPAPAGLVRAVGFVPADRGASRVVVTLKKPARVAASYLMPGLAPGTQRLIVDLQETTAEAFRRDLPAPPKAASEPQPAAAAAARLPPPTSPPPAAAEAAAEDAEPMPVPVRVASAPRAKPRPIREAVARLPVGVVPVVHRDDGRTLVLPPGHDAAHRATRKPVVVIDPGHGGVDSGAVSMHGRLEKDLTLAHARELQRQLQATGRYTVVLTRDGDKFMRLRERIAFARNADADLFVSLHADSLADPRFRGGSVYTLSDTASDEEAAALAAKENKADLIVGVDLTASRKEVVEILIDLAQRQTMNESTVFARKLIDELSDGQVLLKKAHRYAGFAVLKAPDVPSVLLEMGYLSNDEDERVLFSPEGRAAIAAAAVRAIDHYFDRRPMVARP